MVDGIQELVNVLQTDAAEPSKTYHAEVSHIDSDGTVWVYLEGATKETPTATASTEVKAGDSVNVEWRNNKLYIAGNISNPSAGFNTVRPSVKYVNELIDKDITVNSINAATGYIRDLTADHITAGDISASSGYIKELTSEHITAQDIISDHAEIGDLDVNYAKINAANVDSATIQNAWVNKILVQTGLIAHEGTVFTLDAIQVNAANITAGTLDVNRLIVTVEGQKYLVNIDPSTGTPSYQKLDGNIVEPRTITADKIVAGAITTNEITTNNLQGTSGWINLHDGTFFYGNGASFATSNNAIEWNGTKLQIKADEFLLSSGQTIQDSIEAVENWFYSVPPTTSNEPAVNWTTTNLKEQHLRDIYFDTTSGKSYRWAKEGTTYKWVEIEDVELAALAKDLHDNYPPRSEFTVAPDKIQSTVSAAQTAAANAANTATDNKLKSYSTTTQMNSAIEQKAGEITASVSSTYETKSDATSKLNTAKGYTDSEITSAKAEIKVTTDGISTEVGKKVGNDEVISRINQSAESIKIQADKVNIEGAAIFTSGRLSENSLNNAYDVKNAASTAVNNLKDDLASSSGTTVINGGHIETGTLNADKITTGLLTDASGENYWNLDTGQFVTKQGEIADFNITDEALQKTVTSSNITETALLNAKRLEITQTNSSTNGAMRARTSVGGFESVYQRYLPSSSKYEVFRTKVGGANGVNFYYQSATSPPDDPYAYATGTNTGYVAPDKNGVYIHASIGSQTVSIGGKLTCSGTKSRQVETDNYSDRLLYCYETPTPLFGDIGEATIDEDGYCYVDLDDIFSETIAGQVEYQVFLQKEGEGDCWIADKQPRYFIIQGTPNLKVAWELKAKQKGYSNIRLEQDDYGLDEYEYIDDNDITLQDYINEQEVLLYGNY